MPTTTTTRPKIILFIPQLIDQLTTWKLDFGFTPENPIFTSLLQSYKIQNTSIFGYERSLFSELGLPVDNELPIARNRFEGDTNGAEWQTIICADPVHCQVGMNDITLTNVIDDLTAPECMEIIDELNQHFIDDGLVFLLDKKSRWYLALAAKEEITTTLLDDVIGKNIFQHLPHSKVRNWQQIQNEVQMLLHQSSLNQTREFSGESTVNSLWFWGGGQEYSSDINFECVYGGSSDNSSIGQTFAKASNSKWTDFPEDSSDIIELFSKRGNHSSNQNTVIILDQLISPSRLNSIDDWQQQVSLIEEKFIKPLMTSWKNGEIELEIDTCNGKKLAPLKASMWSNWYYKYLKKRSNSLLDLSL